MAHILYFFREGVRGFYHAKLMTFVSIVTIAIVLFFALVAGIGMLNVRMLLASAVEKADIVVYVKDPVAADPAALRGLLGAVRAFPQVQSAAIVDKDASWKRFAEIYGSEIQSAIDGNPLPASLEISLKPECLADSTVSDLTHALSSLAGVENVRYAREWLEFLARFQHWFYWTLLIVTLVMVATLHVTISNTVKLTIYARKELVQNMRLVGATRFFTAMPFIVEGMIQGFAGGAIAAAAFIVLKTSFAALPVAFGHVAFGHAWVAAVPIPLGLIFGWIGSLAAVRKFLN